MKKFFILCIVFIACSGNNIAEETVENSATASSLFQPATTIYKFKSLAKYGYTLEEIDGEYCIFFLEFKADPMKCFNDELEALEDWEFRIDLEDYRKGWISKLLNYPLLTEQEYKKSIKHLESIVPASIINVKIKGEEYSCVDKDSGTVIDRFANEIHPINLYQDGLEATLKNVYRGYVVSLDYNCTHVINGSSFPLYGPLFYQDNQWWGFEEYDDSYTEDYEKDIDLYGFMTKFAKRIPLGEFIDNRTERRGIFPYDEDYGKKATLAKVTLPIADGIITTVDISPKNTIRTYEIIYPQVKNHPSQACYDSINTEIENYVTTYVESDLGTEIYRKEIKEEEYDPGGYSYYSWMNLRYEIIEASDEVYSLFLYWDSYGAGAAHPISDPHSFNYDIKNCKKITILDLFDTNKNYVEGGYVGEKYIDIIHREVVLQLCAPETVESCESYAYSFDNFYDEPNIFLAGTTEFAIGQYGLFIQFWEYDFGYSSGEELILLPWHDISITLNKNGPYSDILKIYSQKNELATEYEPEWEFDN